MGHYEKYNKEYRKTPIGRASHLIDGYNAADKKYNRGKGDLKAQWVAENILSKPCAHCGKTGWNIIGCNRIDDTKPHTMDNVEPCCLNCNIKLAHSKRVEQIDKITREVLKQWSTPLEVEKTLGYNARNIASCCRGERKSANNFIWKYVDEGVMN